MILYGLKTCDTCQRAVKSLLGAGHTVTFADVRTSGISALDLKRFLSAFGADLLNRRSTTWRSLDDSERNSDPLALLVKRPLVMKRPLIDAHGVLTLGWTKEIQAKYL